MPDSGFSFRYRLCGQDATVRSVPFDTARPPSRGDIVAWDGRVIRSAKTGDPGFVGAALEGWNGSEGSSRLEVIIDADAVYAVTDSRARTDGACLDVAGETGSQSVGECNEGDFVVVGGVTATQETLVRIGDGKHYEVMLGRFDPPGPASSPAPRARLSPDDENRLVMQAAAGDERASAQLVHAYLPAISGVARLYRQTSVDRTDLTQEGVVGLMRAVQRFDPSIGRPFWAYAGWWVRQAMQQLVSELTRPAALSDRAMRALARVKRARHQLMQAEGRDPTLAELAAATQLSHQQIQDLLTVDSTPRGLEEPLDSESGASTWGDLVVDHKAEKEFDRVIERMEVDRVRALVDRLAKREREILHDRYGLGRPARTLQEIGDDLGVSAERVRQIEAAALSKLREAAAG